MFNKEKILNVLKKFLHKFKFIKNSFNKCKIGEEKLNKMLWCWCLLPNLAIFFIDRNLFSFLRFGLMKVFYLFYNLMCLYFILKAVSVHPEYNVTRVEKIKQKEYIDSLSAEELKKYKSDLKKEKAKNTCKKLLLMKPWKTFEFYKTVRLILILIILVTIKNLIY